MGSVCCCLSFDDFEDYVNPNSPVYRNCVCLSCLVQNLLNVVCLYILSSSWFMEGQFSVLCFAVHNLNLIGPPPPTTEYLQAALHLHFLHCSFVWDIWLENYLWGCSFISIGVHVFWFCIPLYFKCVLIPKVYKWQCGVECMNL